MKQERPAEDEQRFNTTRLLEGVQASDASLDDIMQEFGSLTVKPAPLTAGGKPHVEGSRSNAYASADTIWASLEAEILADIDAEKAEKFARAKASAPQPVTGKAAAARPATTAAASAQQPAPQQNRPAPQPQSRPAPQPQAARQTATKSGAGTAAAAPAANSAAAPKQEEISGAETLRASRFRFVELDLQQPAAQAAAEPEIPALQQQEIKKQAPQQAVHTAQQQAAQPAAAAQKQDRQAAKTQKKQEKQDRRAAAAKAPDSIPPDPAPEAPLPHAPVPGSTPPGQPYGQTAAPVRNVLPDLDAEPAPEDPAPKPRRQKREKPEAPPVPEPSASTALRSCSKALRGSRTRFMPALVLSILAAVLTLAAAMDWTLLSFFESAVNRNLVLIAIQVLTMLLCYDVIVQGLRDLFHLRLAMPALSLLTFCLILAEALVNLQDATPSFCAAGCLMLTLTLRGHSRRNLALCRSLKVLTASDSPTDVRSVTGIQEDGACLIRTAGVPDGFQTDLEKTDQADTVLGVYGPLLLAATLAASLALHTVLSVSFFWLWAALVCAGLPLAGALCFTQPWALTAGRLQRSGAAISGWQGVRTLCGAQAVTILDEDIYPAGSVQLSGMKLFENYRAELVVGYAASLILPLGGSLAGPFRSLQEEQGAQLFTPTGLRAFEGGGIGGDIRGDVVLAGSMSFMQLMGIRLPRGTNVRQAVYVAINGELAGLFAVTYQKSKGVRKALLTISREPSMQTLFAVRDFLMSPALLRQLFGLPAEGLEYPRVEVRLALSEEAAPGTGRRGAILTRNGLPALAETVCGAARLRRTTRRNLLLAVLAGILGAALTMAGLLLGLRQALLPLLALAWGLLVWAAVSISSLFAVRY